MLKLLNILSNEIQDHKLKFFMVSFKAFNLLIQESYDVKRVACARSEESANRMNQALLKASTPKHASRRKSSGWQLAKRKPFQEPTESKGFSSCRGLEQVFRPTAGCHKRKAAY
jgi:hypothetical protein